jgi:hypothetical protein
MGPGDRSGGAVGKRRRLSARSQAASSYTFGPPFAAAIAAYCIRKSSGDRLKRVENFDIVPLIERHRHHRLM